MTFRFRPIWLIVLGVLAFNLVLSYMNPEWGFLDEYFYVPAAIGMLNGQSCTIPVLIQTTPCNYEHPPLAKALTALSIYLFTGRIPSSSLYGSVISPGPSPTPLWFLAWRFFPLVMGVFSIALIYIIARRVSQNEKTALIAAGLMALEPIYLFFSRTAYLDIPMIFFALCGFAVYLSWTSSSRFWVAGLLMACSVLSKETGIIFVIPFVTYHMIFGEGRKLARTKEGLVFLASTFSFFAVGLQTYDTLGKTPFPTFLNQVAYIWEYATGIARSTTGLGPFAWITFYSPGPNSIYQGLLTSLPLAWMIYLWIPLGIYAFSRLRKHGASPETRLLLLATLLFLSTFLENVAIFEAGRVTYIWYYLTCVPGLSLGGAYLLSRPRIPRLATAAALLFVAGWFLYALVVASPVYSV